MQYYLRQFVINISETEQRLYRGDPMENRRQVRFASAGEALLKQVGYHQQREGIANQIRIKYNLLSTFSRHPDTFRYIADISALAASASCLKNIVTRYHTASL